MYKFTIREPYWQFGGISVDISKCSDEEFETENDTFLEYIKSNGTLSKE